eukprot:2195055-Pyramimonas_sp.AAC.1
MGRPLRTSCASNCVPGEPLSTGARPARDRGSRGGAVASACPGGMHYRALPALRLRCIRAA